MTTHARRLARFVRRASWDDLSDDARRELKIRVLDSVGCAVGAVEGEPVRLLRDHVADFGGSPRLTPTTPSWTRSPPCAGSLRTPMRPT